MYLLSRKQLLQCWVKRIVFCLLAFALTSLYAAPAHVIILRHAEKLDKYALCNIGQERSLAIRDQYLGKEADKGIFVDGPPVAILGTTLHTLETATPTANSWRLPITTYPVVPLSNLSKDAFMDKLSMQTRRAGEAVMSNPDWQGKTVILFWEHRHINNPKLADQTPQEVVDLVESLHLDQLPTVYKELLPKKWYGTNYNMIWIVDYDDAGKPVSLRPIRQRYTGQYANLPDNDWGVPENLPANSLCIH